MPRKRSAPDGNPAWLAAQQRRTRNAERKRAYQRALDAFVAAREAFDELEQAHQLGRLRGSEAVAFDDYTAELRERVRQIHEIVQAEYEQMP